MTLKNKIGTLLHKHLKTIVRSEKRLLCPSRSLKSSWCNKNASTINLKCNEIFTKGLHKYLKDFAKKRQVKHTSTVLEPSNPFHTLVDAEGIANDKVKTHDLTLEVNNITK